MASSWTQMRAAMSIVSWIACSTGLILFNKRLLSGWFPYPMVLTLFHMTFATIITWSLRGAGVSKAPLVNFQVYRTRFVPIAALFAMSLILSNYAYLYLSVSFIQMLKASTPMAVLLLSFATGLKFPNLKLSAVVLAVSVGVVMAAYGEILWSTVGVVVQIGGIIVEAARLVTIQIVLQEVKLSPLDSLSLYAPACALFLLAASIISGELATAISHFSEWRLLEMGANVLVAFALNLVTLWLVLETSSLVLTMCGVLKDILLIFLSKVLFVSKFTVLQVIGYSISLSAIYVFNQLSSTPPPPPPDDPDEESSPRTPTPTSWHTALPLRHVFVGLLITSFLILGLALSDPTPSASRIPNLKLPQTYQGTGCRTQHTVRYTIRTFGGTPGGVEALFQLYGAVHDVTPFLPWDTQYASVISFSEVHERFRERYSNEYKATFQDVPIPKLGTDPDIYEIVIIPEVMNCFDMRHPKHPHLHSRNSRVLVWQLASRPTNPKCDYISHVDFLRNRAGLNLPPWAVIRPYLSHSFLLPAMDAGLQPDGSLPISKLAPNKKRLVLIDDDTPASIVQALKKSGAQHNFQATVVTGFTPDTLITLFASASVVVDWCLVGAERMPLESSLYGAVFTSSRCVGTPTIDLPIPEHYFVETEADLIEKVLWILDNWTTAAQEQNPLRKSLVHGKSRMREDTLRVLQAVTPPLCANTPTLPNESPPNSA